MQPITLLEPAGLQLRVRHWPSARLRPPPQLEHAGDGEDLLGPPCVRRAARMALGAAGLPFVDRCELPSFAPPPTPGGVVADLLAAWWAGGTHGIACGLTARAAQELTVAAVAAAARPALVVVPDTAAATLWRAALQARGLGDDAVAVVAIAAAAAEMHWRWRQHDTLVVDQPVAMPFPWLCTVVTQSGALARLAFAADADDGALLDWTAGLGPVFAAVDRVVAPTMLELRLPLPDPERTDYDAAWHEFLGAFDAFAALQPTAGFGTFVQVARTDPRLRPGLLAWHRALHAAAWNAAKADAVARLLARHRGQRVLVFTPDRDAAYAIARAHLVPPITAELPRQERTAMVAAFVRGDVRVLVGPRLLDHGVPEGIADVGILVGGGFGRAQRRARCRRVAPSGVVYELVAIDTVEVGRAQRWRGTVAAPAVVVDECGRRTDPGVVVGP